MIRTSHPFVLVFTLLPTQGACVIIVEDDDVSDVEDCGASHGNEGSQGELPSVGTAETTIDDPPDFLGQIVINELNAQDDWIEFYNASEQVASFDGMSVADSPFIEGEDSSSFFNFPEGIVLNPGEYISFQQGDPGSFHFGLYGRGERINLYAGPAGTGEVIDTTQWPSGAAGDVDGDGLSWGRWPNGIGEFKTLSASRDAANVELDRMLNRNDEKRNQENNEQESSFQD